MDARRVEEAEACAPAITREEWDELKPGHTIEKDGLGGMFTVKDPDKSDRLFAAHEDDEDGEGPWDLTFEEGRYYFGDLETANAVRAALAAKPEQGEEA